MRPHTHTPDTVFACTECGLDDIAAAIRAETAAADARCVAQIATTATLDTHEEAVEGAMNLLNLARAAVAKERA